jgi:hypothetical protein
MEFEVITEVKIKSGILGCDVIYLVDRYRTVSEEPVASISSTLKTAVVILLSGLPSNISKTFKNVE